MKIRKAAAGDLDQIGAIYNRIHDLEESGELTVGWIRDIYPTRKTALDSLDRGDLFVMEEAGTVVAAAIINQIQVPEYRSACWKHEAADDQVMVLHTLTVDPLYRSKGYGKAFVSFYEQYAKEQKCSELRLDTNARNSSARGMYDHLGFEEVGIIPCTFNGIPDVMLVCLEKHIG